MLKLIIPYPLALKNYPHDRAVPSCGNLILGKCFLNNKWGKYEQYTTYYIRRKIKKINWPEGRKGMEAGEGNTEKGF